MMMFPVYDQQQPCYYYSDPIPLCQQFAQVSPPIVTSSQVEFLRKYLIILILISIVDPLRSITITSYPSFIKQSS